MKPMILIITTLLVLTGCVSFKDKTPPPTLFMLNADEKVEIVKAARPYTIIIDKPKIRSGLNTKRIALIRDQGRVLDYFADARWNGRLDIVLQDFMIESLESSVGSISVSDTAIHQKADFKLVTSVHDFQAEYPDGDLNSRPYLSVSFSVSVIRLKDNKLVSDIKIREKLRASSNTLTDITDGLETLARKGFAKVHDELVKVQ